MSHRWFLLLVVLAVSSNSLARGPASTMDYGSGDGSVFFLLLVIAAFYVFITSKFGMTWLLFSMVTVSVVLPLWFAWYAFRDGSAIQAIAYSSLLISFYWGPLFATLLPEGKRYQKIREFGSHIAFLALIGFFPAALIGGVLSMVFDSEDARAVGVLGTLCFLYYWSTKEHVVANDKDG